MEKVDVLVIGAGAAGCFAAIQVKEHDPQAKVLILEKSAKALAKVKISGGGRCNVTNVLSEPGELAKNYPRGERFLKRLFYEFSSKEMVAWLAKNGVDLKLYPDGCYFPVSNDSQTIIDLFLNRLKQQQVPLLFQQKVERLTSSGEEWIVTTDKGSFSSRNVIITIGGQPKSTGFSFLENLGLRQVEPVPSLFTFNLPGNPVTGLMGIVQENAIVKLQGQKWTSSGPLLITHWGMSGPAILKASAFGARFLAEHNYEAGFSVNWIGETSFDSVRKTLTGLQVTHKQVGNQSYPGIKSRLWEYLLDRAGIAPERKWSDLGAKQSNKLLELLVNDSYEMSGKTTFKEEFVTAGGISLDELDAKSLESKQHPGLFFAGEVLDVDGITGGFNFQAAWTTAYAVAKNIRK